jgi:hypothetical protein
MVDRASYPFRGSNLGHPSGVRRLRADGDEAAAAKGGAAAEPPERRFGALKLAVRSQKGVAEDGEAGGDVGEALEGRR